MRDFDMSTDVFGPVPSRRLGQSLGVKNVPAGTCTYNCVYCQLGQTDHRTGAIRNWYDVEIVLESLIRKEAMVRELGQRIDYVTFVPNGEPTLDGNLLVESSILSSVGIRTAIITNASLINVPEVQNALCNFDRVMVKVDTVDEISWRRLNRPHKSLNFNAILDGLQSFTEIYSGRLDAETMLVADVNDSEEELVRIAAFLKGLDLHTAYLSVPSRPPSESWVRIPSKKSLAKAYAIFDQHVCNVEYLVRHEGNDFVSTGNIEKDLLAIIEVHPMRRDAVMTYLDKAGVTWDLVERLLALQEMEAIPYNGKTYYIRKQKSQTEVRSVGQLH